MTNILEYLTLEALEAEHRAASKAVREAAKYLTDVELELYRRGGHLGFVPDAIPDARQPGRESEERRE